MNELWRISENSSNITIEAMLFKALSDSLPKVYCNDDVAPCRLPSKLVLPRETRPTTSIILLLHSHLSMIVIQILLMIIIQILLMIIMIMVLMTMNKTKGGSGLRERLFLTLLGDSTVPSLSCAIYCGHDYDEDDDDRYL